MSVKCVSVVDYLFNYWLIYHIELVSNRVIVVSGLVLVQYVLTILQLTRCLLSSIKCLMEFRPIYEVLLVQCSH